MPRTLRSISSLSHHRILSALFVILIPTSASADKARFTSLTNDTQEAEIVSIDADGVVVLVNAKSQLDELRRIETSTKQDLSLQKPIKIVLSGEGVLYAESVSIVDEICVVSGHGLTDEPLRLPIDLVQSIQLQPKQLTKTIIDSFQNERDEDQLVLLVDGDIESIDGLIENLDDSEVTFVWGEKTRTLPRKSLIAVGVASAGITQTRGCVVQFSNGSSLVGNIQGLKSNKLDIAIADDLTVTVDWNDVHKVDIRSDRLQFLADVRPVSFEHKPIVTSKRTWRKNQNVSGNQLRLGKRIYSNGIGVASHSRLEYQLKSEFATFCATIGIDAETDGHGECVFVVRADGSELAREPMKAADDPRKLQIDISGVQQLELIVESGADLDLADHANWCDACLLRK